jgi:hypothetical protein
MRKTKEQTEMRTEIIGALKTPALESPEVRFFYSYARFSSSHTGTNTNREHRGEEQREKNPI